MTQLPPDAGPVLPEHHVASSNRRSQETPPQSDSAGARFPIGGAANEFRRRFYTDVSRVQWNDWRWQLRKRIKTVEDLDRIFILSDDEALTVRRHSGSLPVGITPYYAHLLDRVDATQGLRRTHIPVGAEYFTAPGETSDPLQEDARQAVPGLVHRYPDRVLFLVTGNCSTYCRYCTRSRLVGDPGGPYSFSMPQWERALEYLEQTPRVRDVLLSGGDPLLIATEKLDYLLTRLRAIKHVEFLRIGSKIPVVLPQRITRGFIKMVKKHKPWMSIHFTHPDELTPEVTEAMERLADAGLPLGSQTVLLKGVNDEPAVMTKLMHGLLMRRVKPYYLYQCDPIAGSSHFRTTVAEGLRMIEALRGHTSGYAVPHFVVDTPGGKIPLLPNYVEGRDHGDLLLRNYQGKIFRHPDGDDALPDRAAQLRKVV